MDLLQGTIAPSSIDFVRSGMTFHGSISIFSPKPLQPGHAPYGELNENRRGANSSNESPHSTHANASLNVSSRDAFVDGASTKAVTMPVDRRSVVSTESVRRLRTS